MGSLEPELTVPSEAFSGTWITVCDLGLLALLLLGDLDKLLFLDEDLDLCLDLDLDLDLDTE